MAEAADAERIPMAGSEGREGSAPGRWRGLLAGFAWFSAGLGALVAVGGAAHSVAVTQTALAMRGVLDNRWAVLLSLGITLVSAGAILAVAGWRLRRGARAAFWVAGAASAFLLLQFSVLANAFGGVTGLALLAVHLAAWGLLARAMRAPAPS